MKSTTRKNSLLFSEIDMNYDFWSLQKIELNKFTGIIQQQMRTEKQTC